MLPTSRDQTLIAGVSPVPANVINNLQDQIILLDNYKHSVRTKRISVLNGRPLNNTAAWQTIAGLGSSIIGPLGIGPTVGLAFPTWFVPIPLDDNHVVTAVRALVNDVTAGGFHLDIFLSQFGGGDSQVFGSGAVTSAGAGISDGFKILSQTGAEGSGITPGNTTVAGDWFLYAQLSCAVLNSSAYWIDVDYKVI